MRRALQPLIDFGEKHNCAVLGISHFSKGTGGKEPLERVTGSLAFGALARIVLVAAKITEGETTRRILCRTKSNIGLDHGGFEYDLNQKEIDGYEGCGPEDKTPYEYARKKVIATMDDGTHTEVWVYYYLK